jgi:uncharacterized protein (TIGR02246 family)
MMRKILCLGVLSLVLCITAGAQTTKMNSNEAAVRKMVAEAETAWDAGDVAAYTKLWADDADFVSPAGVRSAGHAELEQHFAKLLLGPFKGTRLSLAVDSVRFLKADVALVDGHLGLSGRHAADGSDLPEVKLLLLLVVTEKSGHWYIDSFREMVPAS